MLHLVANGSLSFHSWPRARFEVQVKEGTDESWRFHAATAKVLIEREWVKMVEMKSGGLGSQATYQATAQGQELISELCSKWVRNLNGRDLVNTHGVVRPSWQLGDEHTFEQLAGKMLCRDCGRLVPCVSKKTPLHPAHQWHWHYGPICKGHLDWVQSQRFTRRRA